MLLSTYSHFKSRRLFRFSLYILAIASFGLFFQLAFAKTASADPAPNNLINFNQGVVFGSGNDTCYQSAPSHEIFSQNSASFDLAPGWCNNQNVYDVKSANVIQSNSGNYGVSGSLTYYFSINSTDKKINIQNVASSGTFQSSVFSYSFQRVAWTENFVEFKIDQTDTSCLKNGNFFGLGNCFSDPGTYQPNNSMQFSSNCANPRECHMYITATAQLTRLSDPATPNDGKSKNQPLAGLDENGQKLKAFENSSNVDISGGDYKFAMPGQISSTVGTLGGLFTTLMSSNSGSCVLTSYVPWVSPLGRETFGRIVNTNFCPNVDFKGSVLDYARQFSVFVVAFIFAFAIYGIARFLFSEAKEWGTPQSGGK